MMMMKQRTIFLISLNSLAVLIAFLVVFFFVFNVRVKSLFAISPESTPQRIGSHARFILLVGILTRPDLYDLRHFLRLLYGIQSSPTADIEVKFVFCNLTKPEQRLLVRLEILRFNDIVILNCTVNMNSGKTCAYFSSLPGILPRHYDYVLKATCTTVFVIPCNSMNLFMEYKSRTGYLLSWDLVERIAEANIPEIYRYGSEDKMYDYPGTN